MNPDLDEDGLRGWLVDYLVNTIGLSPGEIDCDESLNDLAVGSADVTVVAQTAKATTSNATGAND